MRGLFAALLLLLAPGRALAGPQGEATEEAVLAAVGDVMFGRYLRSAGGGFVHFSVGRAERPFAEVPLLRQADVTFGNLETPLMPGPAYLAQLVPAGAIVFRGEPDRALALARGGFDVLSLANNHTANLGAGGAAETRRRLEAAGVQAVGAGRTLADALRVCIVTAGGLRLAFLALTLWNSDRPAMSADGAVAYLRPEDLLRRAGPLLQAARGSLSADWVIVSLHWGEEYAPHPTDAQRTLARALVDAGADLVLGHHPHVLQDVERYRGALIAYSLGNFLFDNPALRTRQTAVLRVTMAGRGPLRRLREVTLTPVLIGLPDFLPRLASGADHRAIARLLSELAPGIPVSPDRREEGQGGAKATTLIGRREEGQGGAKATTLIGPVQPTAAQSTRWPKGWVPPAW